MPMLKWEAAIGLLWCRHVWLL